MKKLSIKKIIEFRGKSKNGKKNFAASLKQDKINANTEGGGDYWVSCLSAISNSFKLDDVNLIIDKKNELKEKYEETELKRTKLMYSRNISILSKFEDINFDKWKPIKKIKFLKKRKENSIISIRGMSIDVNPHHIFTYQKNGIEEIGAIWFIAKLYGFKKDELGMFTEALYRYLKVHYSKEYLQNIVSRLMFLIIPMLIIHF